MRLCLPADPMITFAPPRRSSSLMRPATSVAPFRTTTWEGLPRASLMTAIAGFVDAVGYTATGHLYLSFMSGNSTQFGMAVARGDTLVIGWAGAVIATFVLGAFL